MPDQQSGGPHPGRTASDESRIDERTMLAPSGTVAAARIGTHAVVVAVGDRVTIGRDASNALAFPADLLVSRQHAEVVRTPRGFDVIDVGSSNGTYVNGQRVYRAPLDEGDLIAVGHSLFRLDSGQLVEVVDRGPIALQADGLTVLADSRRILSDVSFSLPRSNLLAVVGPSGAGKSTLLGALTGGHAATSGSVLADGRDLYANYDELRHQIGLVPQEDILHRQLTVARALDFAAELRFPEDVTAVERGMRIAEVCQALGLTQHRDKRIDKLSGGQRKRVSVALELLTRPSLLFLDEPTSGLDPGLDKQVMQELRRLADEGRTVVVVTHSVLNLDLCDQVLLLAPGGRTAYFGPPGDALLQHFRESDFSTVFERVSSDPQYWGDVYESTRRPEPVQRSASIPAPERHGPERAIARQSAVRQFAVLCRRMIAIMLADRGYAAFVVALPVALAILSRVVQGDYGLSDGAGVKRPSEEPQQILAIMIIGAAFMGTAIAVRELVGEVAIYQRERSVGLSPMAYLASKVTVLGLIGIAQSALVVVLALAFRGFPEHPLALPIGWLEIAASIALLTLASIVIGLLISTRVTSADQTMPALVLVVMVQLVFCGGLFRVSGVDGLEQASWLIPSKWAFSATAATIDLRKFQFMETQDAFWRHNTDAWLASIVILLIQITVLLVATRIALMRHEPRLPRRRSARP